MEGNWGVILLSNPVLPLVYAEWQEDFDDYLGGSLEKDIILVDKPLVELSEGRDLNLVALQDLHFTPEGILPIARQHIVSIIKLQRKSKFQKKIVEAAAGKKTLIRRF